jgi:hypothetical protein
MRLAIAFPLLVACHSAEVSPAPPAQPIMNATAVAPVAMPAAPTGTVGICTANPQVAGVDDGHQPVLIAACPNPMEMTRGNGIGSHTFPSVTPSVTPNWDLDGTRAYVCAYACAPAGAKVAMLAWSILEDPRPLRNHYAAYLVADASAKKWTVVVMWRHAINLWWNIGGGFHDPARPIHDFDHAPSTDEIEAVLDDNRWHFADDGDFKLLAGNMIDETWPSAPQHHFPDGIEK